MFINSSFVRLPALFPKFKLHTSDRIHPLFGRKNVHGREEFIRECKETVTALKAFPCISTWVIFNEGWGEAKPSYFYNLAKKLDPKMIFDTASGWYEADSSDVFSIHTYTIPGRRRKNRFNRLFLLSEIGGIGLKEEGFPYPKRFGHSLSKSEEELKEKRTKLYRKDVLPQIKKYGLCGVIYTQLSDCECEANGLFDFNRTHQKIDNETRKKLNQGLYDEFNRVRR